MTKRIRIILFLIFLFLFILITPLAIFYSQGYRFDLEKKKLVQTGGLFIKAIPKPVEIYIDGKLIKKTDFFFGSALIENLLPKKYKIRIEKEGYQPWEKILEVREKEVTEVKNLVLFPKNLNFNILTKGVENFWFSPDEKKMILKEISEEGWVLKLYDLERNIKSRLISEKDVYLKGADLMNLEFSKDSKEIYLDVGMAEQEKNFVLKLDKLPLTLTEREISTSSENIIASFNSNGDFYYLDNFGHLFKNKEKITEKPFPVKAETEYSLEIFGDFKFLKEDKTLYYFNSDSKSFEKFFENLNGLKISPDLKKLAYFSDHEIWILFLKDWEEKKAGEKLFLVRLSKKIENVFWLNSDYLIFNTDDGEIKVVEIDDRNKIQIWEMGQMESPKIYFNQRDKRLYLLKDKDLYFSEPLIK